MYIFASNLLFERKVSLSYIFQQHDTKIVKFKMFLYSDNTVL